MSALVKRNGQPDYNLAFALYMRRLPQKEIAQQSGYSMPALQKVIYRHDWVALRGKAENAAPAQKISMAQRSEIVREALAADLQATVEVLPNMKQTAHPVGLRERQEAINSVVTGAEKVFQWKDGQDPKSLNILNIQLLQQAAASYRVFSDMTEEEKKDCIVVK